MNDEPLTQAGDDDELDEAAIAEGLFQDVTDRYIGPEVVRRREAGDWDEDELVRNALISFGQDGAVRVLLNEEVKGMVTATATRPLEKGETVFTEDIGRIADFSWENDDGHSTYIAVLPCAAGMALLTKYRHNVKVSSDHLDAAEEFLNYAVHASSNGHCRVFIENAYGACELLAKAELLRLAGNTLSDSKSHERVRQAYNLWAKLGNTEHRFAQLLNRIARLRRPARYLEAPLELSTQDIEDIAGTLHAMHEHVVRVAPRPGRDPEDEVPVRINAIARRDLKAGQLLTVEDVSIFPPKPPKTRRT